MQRFGCRRCGTPLPAVQAGEILRVRCAGRACGFVNVIPADPALAPWEALGSANLLVVDDPDGAVLLAPPQTRARSHKLFVTLCFFLSFVGILAIPSLRRAIILRCAMHEVQTTNSARNAQFWCQRLKEIGPSAQLAAPLVWNLHFRTFERGAALKEPFINDVIAAIAPDYLAQRRPPLADKTSISNLITALQFPETDTRKLAADLLGKRGPAALDAVPALISLAERPQDDARSNAIVALGRIGPKAVEAVSPLIKLLNASGTLRSAAAHSLLAIAPGDQRVLAAIDSAGIPLADIQPAH